MSSKPNKEPENMSNKEQESTQGGRRVYTVDISTMKPEGKQLNELSEQERHKLLSDAVKAFFELFDNPEAKEVLKDAEERERVLTPYIEKVLADPKNKEKYKGITAKEVLDNLDVLGRVVDPGEVTAEILKKANKIKRASDARAVQTDAANNTKNRPHGRPIHYNRSSKETKLTTTKLTNSFFDPMPDMQQLDGQMSLILPYTPRGGEDCAILTATFSMNEQQLEDLGIDPNEAQLDYGYDFFIMSALDQLYYEGNEDITLSKLCKQMGITPSQKEMEKLTRSLFIGSSIKTRVNNKEVLEAWNINTEEWTEVIGDIMPITIERKYRRIDGNLSKMQIHIGGFSPFWKVSQPLGHLSSWDNALFSLYTGKRTPKYWRLMRYLTKEIAWMRNDKGSDRAPVLKLESIYAFVGDTTRQQKRVTKQTTYQILKECFAPLHYIDGSKTKEDPKTGNIEIKPNTNEQRQKLLKAENEKSQNQSKGENQK